jgi:hypothetical protein
MPMPPHASQARATQAATERSSRTSSRHAITGEPSSLAVAPARAWSRPVTITRAPASASRRYVRSPERECHPAQPCARRRGRVVPHSKSSFIAYRMLPDRQRPVIGPRNTLRATPRDVGNPRRCCFFYSSRASSTARACAARPPRAGQVGSRLVVPRRPNPAAEPSRFDSGLENPLGRRYPDGTPVEGPSSGPPAAPAPATEAAAPRRSSACCCGRPARVETAAARRSQRSSARCATRSSLLPWTNSRQRPRRRTLLRLRYRNDTRDSSTHSRPPAPFRAKRHSAVAFTVAPPSRRGCRTKPPRPALVVDSHNRGGSPRPTSPARSASPSLTTAAKSRSGVV